MNIKMIMIVLIIVLMAAILSSDFFVFVTSSIFLGLVLLVGYKEGCQKGFDN